jgi:hypothetical protein
MDLDVETELMLTLLEGRVVFALSKLALDDEFDASTSDCRSKLNADDDNGAEEAELRRLLPPESDTNRGIKSSPEATALLFDCCTC